MTFRIFLTIALFASLAAFSQQQKLIVKSNGNIYNEQGDKFTPEEIRVLLEHKPALLEEYNSGRDKKSIGNFLMIAGSVCIFGDLALGFAGTHYPTALTIVGVPALIIGIPVKIGFRKKIRHAVSQYNNQVALNDGFKVERIAFCAGENTIGFKMTF
ncbi:MAG: hypothetical protein EOO48_08610 [Flavobacterium sp.]|nr:MAG: hypothetical protein EOO48_08610 [Flavobacterium sp.]